ncbi:MAG: Ribonuclease H [Microgenomates group bacterium GW2011_GWF2_47_9]|nr:MAG: Ribonuclease H [Microgenomates group bacterium GW2011_GWF2_47_9]
MSKLKLFTDGGSRGNPGPAAYGYIILETSGGAEIILEKCGNYLGITTNNQAEYEGLIAGLKWVVTNHPTSDLEVFMDSLLIVNQLKGIFKVKNPELLPKYREAHKLFYALNKPSITHIRREYNSIADQLVNQALDARS